MRRVATWISHPRGLVRHAILRPFDWCHQQRLLHGVFGSGEIAKRADDGAECLRGEFARQALGLGIQRFRRHRSSGGGPLITGRTSIGMFIGAPLTPGAADAFAAIS